MKYEIKHYSTNSKKFKKNDSRILETIKSYRPIRIYLETTYFDSQNVGDFLESKKPLLKNALKLAIKGLSGLLEVEDIGDYNIFSFINPNELFYKNYIYSWDPIFDSGSNIQSDFLIIVKFSVKIILLNMILILFLLLKKVFH